jgi:ABC-type histidine transport system ATPase subunit
MILVTHAMDFARSVADRVLFLHAGRVEAEGPAAELFARPDSSRLQQFLAASLRAN